MAEEGEVCKHKKIKFVKRATGTAFHHFFKHSFHLFGVTVDQKLFLYTFSTLFLFDLF